MKRFALGVALMCALSATAVAGEIPSTGITGPPPPPPGETHTPPSVTAPGDMPTCGVTVLLTILDFAF